MARVLRNIAGPAFAGWVILLAGAPVRPAVAQPADTPAPTPATEPATEPETEPEPATEPATEPDDGAGGPLTADDFADIEAALGADAAELQETRGERGGIGAAAAAAVQSMNPDIAIITDVAAAWFSDDENLQTGAHDPSETGFNLQQLEMSIGGAVDPYFRFDANLVFAQFGVEIEEAYATTLALPYSLQARVGQFLTRIGRLNATHPHAWDFVDQPIVLGKFFGGEGNRGLGGELSYLTPLPWYVEIVGSVTDPAGEATARSFFGPQDLDIESPLDFQSTLAVKQFFDLSANWSLMWGLSAATGPNPTGHDNRSDLWGTDLYIKYRPITRQSFTVVSLQAEWYLRRRQIPGDLISDHGLYAQLFWRFARRWGTAARYEYVSPASESAGVDYLDPAWTDYRHRASANLTFWPSEFSRIRVQGALDVPTWRDDPIAAAFLSFEFLIGAHGAHTF